MEQTGYLFGGNAFEPLKPLDLYTAERLPLVDVLERLGCYVAEDKEYHPQKHSGSRRYRVSAPGEAYQRELVITGQKWYDTRGGKGNHNIINLVKHVFSESFSAAKSRIEGKPIEKPKRNKPIPEVVKQPPMQFYTADYLGSLPLKDDKYTMEFPFFALKAGEMKARTYDHQGVKVIVKPGYDGMATMDDKDLWIFAISHLIHAINQGKPVCPTVRFKMADFLKATGRRLDGDSYKRATKALNRLKGTSINTNIKTPNYNEQGGFGLIDSWRVIERNGDGKTVAVEITLPIWVMCSVEAEKPHVLTLHPDYFNLRKPLARRLYELVRKHCGIQNKWLVSMKVLHEKSGSTGSLIDFRKKMKKLEEENNLPDYKMKIFPEKDQILFFPREEQKLEKLKK